MRQTKTLEGLNNAPHPPSELPTGNPLVVVDEGDAVEPALGGSLD